MPSVDSSKLKQLYLIGRAGQYATTFDHPYEEVVGSELTRRSSGSNNHMESDFEALTLAPDGERIERCGAWRRTFLTNTAASVTRSASKLRDFVCKKIKKKIIIIKTGITISRQ